MHPDVATANSWSQGTSNTHIPTFESPLTPSAAHHLPAAPPPWRSLQGMQRRRQERPPPCRQPDSGLHYPLRQHAPRSSKRSLRCAHRTNPAGGALAGRPASSSSASQNCRLINSSSGSSAGRAVASRAQASAALPQSSSSWQPDMFRNNDSNLCEKTWFWVRPWLLLPACVCAEVNRSVAKAVPRQPLPADKSL